VFCSHGRFAYFGGKDYDVNVQMKKKDNKRVIEHTRPEHDVEFCLNCDDMDDFALSDESAQLDSLHERFENCVQSGRFDGDMCSRLFVAEDGMNESDVFGDDEDRI
jgi:hypothetical protein